MNPILISSTNCQVRTPSKIRNLALYTGASLLIIAGTLPSCGTARGFGRDVEKTGDKIQEAATR